MTATSAPEATSSPPPRRHRGQRIRRWIGVLLILAGLSVLGYVAWQYWGTNVVSKQHQADEKKIIADDWGKGIDGKAIGLLRIERFGGTFEVPIVRGFSKDALARGVGWYTKGAKPGEVGNFAVAGHRVTHGEPFRDFLKLRTGDTAVVETRTHIYTYRLDNDGDDITVPFTTTWPLWRVPDPDAPDRQNTKATKRQITLLTCSELFHTDNRNVVVGHLVKTVDKADPEDRTS